MADEKVTMRRVALSALLGATALTSVPAFAQAQAQEPVAAEQRSDVVIVTARKREESLQEVPMTITAVGGEHLEAAGYTELNDVARISPNIFFEAADRSKPLIFVRGVGTRGYDAGSDPSVGVFVDSVYLGRFGALDMDLLDIERVEMLKGPQGTLYGRNTIGGALSVVTSDPARSFEGKASVEAGMGADSDDVLWSARGSVSGPITDNVRGSLSLSRRHRDGYQEIQGTSVRGGSEDSWAARGKALISLGEAEVRLAADYADMDGPPLILVPNRFGTSGPGALAPGFVVPAEPTDPYSFAMDEQRQGIQKQVYGASAQVDWNFLGLDFTSITAARGMSLDERDDLDGTTLPFQVYFADEESDQFSQELRAAYSSDNLNWLFGLFYSQENVVRTETIDFGPASLLSALVAPADLIWTFPFDLEATAVAAFGQVDWQVTDELAVTVGGRYSEDKKDVVFDTNTTVPGFVLSPFREAVSRQWDSFDPSVSLRYQFNPDLMAYASWATGYKSGAFQFIATSPTIAQQVADPEDVESIEVGLKSTWLDGNLQLNLAAFSMDYKDLQQLRVVPVSGVGLVVIDNAASSSISGAEIEGRWKLSDSWSTDFAFGYLDATFDEFVFNTTLDFSGNQMPRSPKNTFNLALNYEQPTPLGDFSTRLAYSWRDSIFFEADNNVRDPESSEDALGLLDFNAQIATSGGWTYSLWARNLTDERYRRQVLNSTGNSQRGIWAEPRTFGIRASYQFD
jgi:iron complex outermembrane receptor protein